MPPVIERKGEQLVTNHFVEEMQIGDLGLTIQRSPDGVIEDVQPWGEGRLKSFVQTVNGFTYKTEKGVIHLERNPPEGLSRRRSGWEEIPDERRFWVVSISSRSGMEVATIPVKKRPGKNIYGFTAFDSKYIKREEFLPFSLKIDHPDLAGPKTDVTVVSQIFGHFSSNIRLLNALPEEVRGKIHLATRRIQNVPRAIEHLREMGLNRDGTVIPLVYDDKTSGGGRVKNKRAAIWWLAQNPELVDMVMRSKVIISDFREETAWLRQVALQKNLPQIFLGLTYSWAQDIDTTLGLPVELARQIEDLPTMDEKISSMKAIGFTADEAVLDWFKQCRKWKAGIRGKIPHAADVIISYSLLNPHLHPPDFHNVIISPPRTMQETGNETESRWTEGKKRILVVMGAGIWTERDMFVKNVFKSARYLQDCELIIAGDDNGIDQSSLPENVKVLGYVSPAILDSHSQTCDIAIIKPGHFTFEETARKLTLVAPTDNLSHAKEIFIRSGDPLPMIVGVDVVEERAYIPIEEWLSLGSPVDFSPFVDISSPRAIAKKITEALQRLPEFKDRLEAIPKGGSEILARKIVWLLQTEIKRGIDRDNIPELVAQLKEDIESSWPKPPTI